MVKKEGNTEDGMPPPYDVVEAYIRDDKGYWNQIDSLIRDRSEADFSHGICPECAKELYPDL
jgi:hypothetical protein